MKKQFRVITEFDKEVLPLVNELFGNIKRVNEIERTHTGNANSSTKSAWIATEKYYNSFIGLKGHFQIQSVFEIPQYEK